MARIMVTGASGYIGSVVVDHLLKENHQVLAVDWMIFGSFALKPFLDNPNFELLHQDIREIPVRTFRGVDMVCDLAGLPNEQCCALDPDLSREINVHARARVARIAKAMGVKRHIALTSCEAYDVAAGETADEQSPLHTNSVYMRSNQELENTLLSASTEEFSVTILRAGSVYGLSRRMRFDAIANVVALRAHRKRRYTLPGNPKCTLPFIHVRDVARAILATLVAPLEDVSGRAFNLASQSLSFAELMEVAAEVLAEEIEFDFAASTEVYPEANVSYEALPAHTGFVPRISVDQGMLEVLIALKGGRTEPNNATNTAKFYRALIKQGGQSEAHRLT
ncbi:MAG: SDR family oxidoreductase [Alphaproteobacteria bacterium]|nr:SDR family oxidoreductase [Alphaproteobacteria bacterium]